MPQEGRYKMTKKQIETLQKMMEQPDTKGKKLLDQVIWLNTVKPKYKVGDFVEVSDPGHYIGGVPVKNFHARVDKVNFVSAYKKIHYETYARAISGNRESQVFIYPEESEITRKVKDDINILGKKDGEIHDEFVISL